jgi:hypothetical protein
MGSDVTSEMAFGLEVSRRDPAPEASIGATLGRLIARELAKPTIVWNHPPPHAGVAQRAPSGPLKIENEAALLKKVAPFLRKGEKFLISFVARTGLSPLQLAALSQEAIGERVRVCEERASDDVHAPSVRWTPPAQRQQMAAAAIVG